MERKRGSRVRFDVPKALAQIRSHWLSNVVHEMASPLFAARGFSNIVLQQRDGSLNEAQRQHLASIVDNLSKLSALATELSNAPSEQELQLGSVSLSELIRDAIQRLGCSGTHHPSLSAVKQMASAPLWTAGDREKFGVALLLVFNAAVEYAGAGGKIDFHVEQEEDRITLKISATGGPTGLPAASRLAPDLSPFRRIWRLHGGTVHVSCTPERGLMVVAQLPVIS